VFLNCSEDNSKDVIQSYKKKDARIRTIFHEENLGIARTYNDGLDAAEGKYIAFLDSDDVWKRNKLDKQLAILRKDENLVVWSEGIIIDQEGKPAGQTFTQREGGSNRRKSGDIFEALLLSNFVFDSSLIVKRSNIDGIRFDANLKYLNDHRFAIDLARNLKYYFMKEQLAEYRIHGKNTVLRDPESWLQDEIALRKSFLERYTMNRRTKASTYYRISSAYSMLGEKKSARQYLVKGFNQKSLSFCGPLYVIKLFNYYLGASLLRLYHSFYFRFFENNG
jgi:glycosyltransferase involved in cell wall biosynthesis